MPTPSSFHRSPRRKPPPNYASRSMQVRLLMLVTLLMLVIVAMERARDPKYYRWFWSEKQDKPPLQYIELSPHQEKAGEKPSSDAGAASVAQDDARGVTSLAAARQDGWQTAIRKLSTTQRTQLADTLQARRNGSPPRDIDQDQWKALIETLDHAWVDYIARAESVLASQPREAGDHQEWTAILEQLTEEWHAAIKPQLASLPDAEAPPADGVAEQLAPLQAVLDSELLGEVRDNTVFRSAERMAWFRLVEQLQHSEPPVSSSSPAAREVTYLQLADQPQTYRGQRVRFRGVARGGYRTAATPNQLGVEHFDVLWIKPQDGANAPIAVYCLALPTGFPELADRQTSGEVTPLEQPVAIEGYFFKRWAYPSEQGVSVAPLVVAAEPEWFPEQADVAPEFRSKDLAVAMVVGVLLGFIGLAATFYFVRNAVRPRLPAQDDALVAENLRRLESPQQGP